jgi:DNA-binding CsgD family transcriptional regulator
MINTGRQTLLSGELAAAKSREALKIALSSMRQSFGWDHVSIQRVPAEQERSLSPLMFETTLPGAYLRDFDRGQYLPLCPLMLQMRRSLLPQSWSLADFDRTDAKPALVELFELMERHDLTSGIVFGFFLPDGHRYALRFDGTRSPLSQNEVNELSVLSLQALDVFNQIHISGDQQHNPLSARELEVVSWTAQGKTSVEIGQILTLSDHTVNAYLTNAIRKLDCVNRTQLVAKALRLKLIA